MKASISLWVGRRAVVINPHTKHNEQVGVVVSEPARGGVFLRWPDNTHSWHGLGTLRMLPADEEATDDALSAADGALLRSVPAGTEQRQRVEDLPWVLLAEGFRPGLVKFITSCRPIADGDTHMAPRAEQERDGLRLVLTNEETTEGIAPWGFDPHQVRPDPDDAALGVLEGMVRRTLGATFCLVWSPTWRLWFPYLGGDVLCDATGRALGGFDSRVEALRVASLASVTGGRKEPGTISPGCDQDACGGAPREARAADKPPKLDDDVRTMKGTREELEVVQVQRNQQQAALIARATRSNE